MKTAMQELIDELKLIEAYPMSPLVLRMATDLLEKEKEQIIEFCWECLKGDNIHTITNNKELIEYINNRYNQTYNQNQHIIDIMKADEDDGLYKMFDTDSDKKH
jgi:DNA-binding GntR family transcriptional regulator